MILITVSISISTSITQMKWDQLWNGFFYLYNKTNCIYVTNEKLYIKPFTLLKLESMVI